MSETQEEKEQRVLEENVQVILQICAFSPHLVDAFERFGTALQEEEEVWRRLEEEERETKKTEGDNE